MIQAIRVILVDDEDDFRQPMRRLLEREGFVVFDFPSIKSMNEDIREIDPDVILLDKILPGEHSLDTLKKLRAETRIGLIMVTGCKSSDERIEGLESGADAYVTKPVDVRELSVLIRSLKERLRPDGVDEWVLNEKDWTLTSPQQEIVNLTGTEFNIVAALSRLQGETVSRENLYNETGKRMFDVEDRSLDVSISRLRAKFKNPDKPLPVKSVRNMGYVFLERVSLIKA